MEGLDAQALLAIWERLAARLPERRLGDLEAGMALDLLERGALDEARAVLDQAAADKPWTADLLRDVERLARVGDAKTRPHAHTVVLYLKLGIPPADLEADRERRAAPTAKRNASALDTLDRDELEAALDAIDTRRSASALLLAYRAGDRSRAGETTRALLPAFAAFAAVAA